MSVHPRPEHFKSELPSATEEIVWVAIDELRLGMFAHPLSREKFLLRHSADLEGIRASGVKGVFVDLSRSTALRPQRGATRPISTPRSLPADNTVAEQSFAVGASAATGQRFASAMATLKSVQLPVENLLNQARLGRTVDSKDVRAIVTKIIDSVDTTGTALVSLARIRTKDRFTYAHSVAVCALMANLAKRMDLDRASQQELALGGLLHDIGKMAMPDEVLNKPGPLSAGEMTVMRSHVLEGHELLLKMSGLPSVALDICLHHHEKVDGTGYPEKLVGERISIAARMAAICDVYDAITSNRPYKEAWSPSECLANMFSWQGHFDPKLLSIFIKSVGIYPVGSMVRMESDHLAVVVEQDEADLTRPTVRLFYSVPLRERIPLREVTLARKGADSISWREEPRNWGFLDWDQQWPRMLSM